VRVVYVAGWCRSGSTVIGNLLGEHPAVAHAGELSYLWVNGVLRAGTNTCCGCGDDLSRCAVWEAVLGRLAAGRDRRELAREMIGGHQAYLRTRHTRARLAEAAGRRPRPAGVSTVLAGMARCYREIAEVTGAAVIVDSSKFPAEAAALCGTADVDTLVLHLVRDPRASAYSWLRAKSYIPAMAPGRSSGYWTAFNAASELIGRAQPGRYLRVRYEDFTARPDEVLTAIMRWAGLRGPAPVGRDGRATLGVNHTVTGNPDRLRRGPVTIAADGQWRRELPRRAALTATALAAPLLPRYGYPLTGWRLGPGGRAAGGEPGGVVAGGTA
jgi:Sulfotransferase family